MFEALLSAWDGFVAGNDLMFNFGFGFINSLVTGALDALIALSNWIQSIAVF